MTLFANIFFSLFAATQFDSDVWFQHRELLLREAERLEEAYKTYSEKVVEPALDVMIPLDLYPDGSVQTMVLAKKAMYFFDDGLLWGENVTIQRFDTEKNCVSEIHALHVIVDRNTKSGWIDGKAEVRHEQTTFEGYDLYFSSPEGYLMCRRGTDIISKGLKFGGVL